MAVGVQTSHSKFACSEFLMICVKQMDNYNYYAFGEQALPGIVIVIIRLSELCYKFITYLVKVLTCFGVGDIIQNVM